MECGILWILTGWLLLFWLECSQDPWKEECSFQGSWFDLVLGPYRWVLSGQERLRLLRAVEAEVEAREAEEAAEALAAALALPVVKAASPTADGKLTPRSALLHRRRGGGAGKGGKGSGGGGQSSSAGLLP